MKKKGILLVEDHALFRAGIAAIIRQSDDFELLAEAYSGTEAVEKVLEIFPDIIIMDIELPELDGIECTRRILSLFPNLKILALTWHEDEQMVLDILRAGVKGFLNKHATAQELTSALQTISGGNHYYSRLASNILMSNIIQGPSETKKSTRKKTTELTTREAEILRLVYEEHSNKEIADTLFISTKTVETHKRNIIQKLKVKGTAGMVKYYIRNWAVNV